MSGPLDADLRAWLHEQGFTDEQIADSFSPMLLPARRALGDDGHYVSARQISEHSGLNLDQVDRILRAAGLSVVDDPDAPVFLAADSELAVHLKKFVDLGLAPDQLLTVLRVLSEGLSHAAETMRYAALSAVLHPGISELEIAKGSKALAEVAVPLFGPMVQEMLMLQMRHAIQTEAVSARERAAGAALPGARAVGAAFADLVGFTQLGELVPPEQLEQMANRLADHARELAVPPVRFIKTIGDAVMLVSSDVAALLAAVLALVDTAEADEALPSLRAGVAYGPAVTRSGDWFGSPVNQASRITSVARPGSVLVSEAAREHIDSVADADGRFMWSFAGRRQLKGVQGMVPLFRARWGSAFAGDGHPAGDDGGDQ